MKKNNSKTIQIPFTKKQFFALMKAVYLGNWIANAHRTDDKKDEYDSIKNYIFSFVPQFGLQIYMEHQESDGTSYYATVEFEENTDVHKLHDEYDENTMWDELADKLGERDFFEKYTEAEIKKMSRDERFEKLMECMIKYEDEFIKSGLSRIRIAKN
ncbi:hypothetical protein ACFL1A_03590 [Patescibacteria group bacterium]